MAAIQSPSPAARREARRANTWSAAVCAATAAVVLLCSAYPPGPYLLSLLGQ